MGLEQIFGLFLTFMLGGGAVAVFEVLFMRKKIAAEVKNISFKSLIEIEKVATTRYLELSKLFCTLETELSEAKKEIMTLQAILHENGIALPEKKKEQKENRRMGLWT